MIPLQSKLENSEVNCEDVQSDIEMLGFVLGGNWDYDHGFFDKALDDKNQVWLRLPFKVIEGQFDGEKKAQDCVIRWGKPFVLRHVYEEGLDEDATIHTYGGLVDQFQDPEQPDAPVGQESVKQAEGFLHKVEELVLTSAQV